VLICHSDEIMYQAKLHPEQYSNTFSDAQVKKLHDAMMYVCNTAVDTLAESDKFPEDWLMKHRWGKGKKDGGKLPNGAKITFLKVGGRTSAVVPSVQKKTGAVAGDVSGDVDGGGDDDEEPKPRNAVKRKSKAKKEKEKEDSEESEEKLPVSTKRGRGRTAANPSVKYDEDDSDEKVPVRTKRGSDKVEEDVKQEDTYGMEDEAKAPRVKKQKMSASAPTQKKTPAKKTKATEAANNDETGGRRRSGRASKA
jgi:formamidopyrimidine-DNA glycosylase